MSAYEMLEYQSNRTQTVPRLRLPWNASSLDIFPSIANSLRWRCMRSNMKISDSRIVYAIWHSFDGNKNNSRRCPNVYILKRGGMGVYFCVYALENWKTKRKDEEIMIFPQQQHCCNWYFALQQLHDFHVWIFIKFSEYYCGCGLFVVIVVGRIMANE